nr:FliG C-terminal domain-containing protein [uncultured Hyphomonas sp.]
MSSARSASNVENLPARRAQKMGVVAAQPAPISSAQRAAVIIALLGESAAKPIVEKLDDVALAKVASALENISMLTRDELVEIVMDFIGHLRKTNGAMRGGRTRAKEVLSGVVGSERLSLLFNEGTSETADEEDEEELSVWERLERKDPKQIATYLSRLSPNLIALILQKLDVSVSSEVLGHMEGEKLGPMIGHMVEPRKTDPGVDQVLGRMVEMEFLNTVQEEAEDEGNNLASVGELLSLISTEKRDSLVAFLRSKHEDKLEGIEKSIFTIEGLPDLLPKNAVPVVFREVDQSFLLKLLSTLQGSNSAVSDYLLGNISSRMADQYRDDLGGAKPLDPVAAETVQREFLNVLMGLKRRELIVLERNIEKDA